MEMFLKVINLICLSYKMAYIRHRSPEECMYALYAIRTKGRRKGILWVEALKASPN